MSETSQKYSHTLNLLLADKFAKLYGYSRGAAIQRAARVIKRETHDKAMYQLASGLVNANNDKRVTVVESLENDMTREGLL